MRARDDVISPAIKRAGRAVCGFALLGVTAACVSEPANPIPPIPPIASKTPEQLCAEVDYDPNIVVFRDQSSRYRLAAVGVTSSGNLEEFAAIVGPSVVTSRGGALATGGGDVDVETRACDTFQ